MELGLFMMPVHPPSKGWQQNLKEDMETIIQADRLGYDEAWIGEHFTIKWEPLPAPDLFIAKAFGLTQNIKLGTGVVLLQLHDPVMLAHRIAVLDHLGEGRFYFGIGTGGVPTEFQLFGIDEKRRHERAAEVMDIVLKIWESDGTLDYRGEFHHVKSPQPWPDIGLPLYVKPLTKPYPPVAVACVSPSSPTAQWAGEKGWSIMSSANLHSSLLHTQWESYQKGAKKAGLKAQRSQWRVCRTIHVAETMEQAREEAFYGGLWRDFSQYSLPQAMATRGNLGTYKPDPEMPDEAVTFDWLIENSWIVGDPDYCTQKIRELYRQVGGFGTLLNVVHDWDNPQMGWKSLRLFMEQVAPALRDL